MTRPRPPEELARSAVRALRECYRVDARATGQGHLLAKEVRCLWLFATEVVFRDGLDHRPLPGEIGEELLRETALWVREKELVYFQGALDGRVRVAGRAHRRCVPVLLAGASVHRRGEEIRLEVDRGDLALNEQALQPLFDSDGSSDEVAALLGEALPPTPWRSGELEPWLDAWREHCPGVDPGPLLRAGELADPEELRRSVRRRLPPGARGRILPVCGVALFPRPRGSRGVLHELTLLAESDPTPALRGLLLGRPGVASSEASAPEVRPPATLSRAQLTAVRSAASSPLTVLVGPPGTGKTFSLAAIALDHVARGRSVLIASGRDEAVAVVEAKLAELAGIEGLVVRADDQAGLGRARDRLAEVVRGDLSHLGPEERSARQLAREVDRVESRLRRLERELERRGRWERSVGGEGDVRADPFSTLARRFRRWQLERLPRHWEQLHGYQELLEERNALLGRWIRAVLRERLDRVVRRDRAQLVAFWKSLRSRQSARQAEHLRQVDPGVLLSVFPLWTATFGRIHRALPFAAGLFDLVIVDEATQCDLATALPTLQRGRRILVTGDPRQLRHVSFLARERQERIAEAEALPPDLREHLDYRDRSLLDAALDVAAGGSVATLDEHFRSHPSLIEFVDREIYGGSLKVMTARPGPRASRLEVRAVGGVQRKDGTNREEIEAVLAEVDEIVGAGGAPVSLGILAVFRDQADALRDALAGRFGGPVLGRHRVRVGTPYAFQGEERDVVLVSLALDADAPEGAWRHLLRRDVFTVAVTRARHRQVVFRSFPPEAARGLVAGWLASAERGHPEPEVRTTRWIEEVAAGLRARGLEVRPGARLAGTPLDLVVSAGGRHVAVDLIGGDDPAGEAVDLERCRVLQRAGLPLFPLPHSAWSEDPDACVAALRRWLGQPPSKG